MRIFRTISRACWRSPFVWMAVLSIATVGVAYPITGAIHALPVPVVKTQDRIIAAPSLEPIGVSYAIHPWVNGHIPSATPWLTRLYDDDEPIVPKPVKTIKIEKPKKQKRSSIDPSALLAYAKAEIGKRGPQLGLPASLYCADFINWVMRKVGLPGSYSRMARSFLSHPNFVRVAKPVPGDIVVIARGRSSVYGHVALYNGSCGRGGIKMLGGNQGGGRVTDQCVYGRSVVGYVRPRAIANDNVQVAANDNVPRVVKAKAKPRVVKRYRKHQTRHAHIEKPYWTNGEG